MPRNIVDNTVDNIVDNIVDNTVDNIDEMACGSSASGARDSGRLHPHARAGRGN